MGTGRESCAYLQRVRRYVSWLRCHRIQGRAHSQRVPALRCHDGVWARNACFIQQVYLGAYVT
jgi:hypothetical protein